MENNGTECAWKRNVLQKLIPGCFPKWSSRAMCYGYFSGGNSYGDLPLNGARIILLEEDQPTFTTWLRRSDGKLLLKVELPRSKP